MQRLGKNHDGYHGETIDIRAVLGEIETLAKQHGWKSERFHQTAGFDLIALHRTTARRNPAKELRRVYISTGVHGDEPAGPLAARQLLKDDHWPADLEIRLLPCLNPIGFTLNRRENFEGKDLNRDYRHLETAEVRAHLAWLSLQPKFDLCLCLHEDWESHGFYLYEQNPDRHPSPAEGMIEAVARVCPIDPSEIIEDRPASGGIIRPNIDPNTRPQWAESFYLIVNKTRMSYTLEAPSDFPLEIRVQALVAAVRSAMASLP